MMPCFYITRRTVRLKNLMARYRVVISGLSQDLGLRHATTTLKSKLLVHISLFFCNYSSHLHALMGDDVLYASALGFSLIAGVFFYEIRSPWLRLHVSTAIGFAVTLAVCGTQVVHPLIATLGSYVILRIAGLRYMPALSFIWVFGYLLFFRLSHLAGYSLPTAPTNLVQLFLSLKLVSLAYDHADAVKRKKATRVAAAANAAGESDDSKADARQASQHPCTIFEEGRTPSLYTLFAYSFCYVGLISGPFVRFRTFTDFIEQHVQVSFAERVRVSMRRGAALLVCMPIYSLVYAYWPLSAFRDEQLLNESSFIQLNVMLFLQFLAQRTRLYAAWRAGELICIMSGCGAYPRARCNVAGGGPTLESTGLSRSNSEEPQTCNEMKETDGLKQRESEPEVDFRTIENVDIAVCETSPRIRECARAWNSCVQFWLFHYVHKRLPISLGAFRTAITMTVSAYWHGLYAGYWMGICSMPLLMLAQDMLLRLEPAEKQTTESESKTKRQWRKVLFDFLMVQFRMRANEYIAIAIAMLDYRDCLRFYRRVYFFWHLILIAMCLISPFVRGSKTRQTRARAPADKTHKTE